jgi:hypothetical protein
MRSRLDIPQSIYAVADYALGAVLIAAPWLCGFSDHLTATAITIGFGAAIIGYSAFTDYQLSAMRSVPLPIHFALDAIVGGLLIGAPFMFGFADRTWIPHLVIGIVTASIAGVAALVYARRHDLFHGRLLPLRATQRRTRS